jgi:hypothetical protein
MLNFSSDSTRQVQSLHAHDAQYAEHKAGHDHIARNIADLMVAGKTIESEEIQLWIGKHFEYICKFWTPNRIAYKSLALTYTMDPAFKATYEAYEVGLALFIQKAIYHWADSHLNDEPIG